MNLFINTSQNIMDSIICIYHKPKLHRNISTIFLRVFELKKYVFTTTFLIMTIKMLWIQLYTLFVNSNCILIFLLFICKYFG